MVIMALDHTREFFHSGAASFQPEDLTRTTAALFFTRWITYFCAPVFMFAAGLSAFLWSRRGRTTNELSVFLWKRGLWLVVLEFTALRFAMYFSLRSGIVLLSILWALGWSKEALGFLARLPVRILTVVSVAVIVLHNLADPVMASRFGSAGWVWNVLHQPGVFLIAGVPVLAAYPLIPWIAVMAAGFCFGQIVTLPAPRRRLWMTRIGLGLTLAFLVIRGVEIPCLGPPTFRA